MKKFKRYIYLFVGTIAMCIYGLMYNWTVFSLPIQNSLNLSSGSVANVFSFCQIFLTLGGLISGFLYYKINFKLSMILSSILLSFGLYMTSKAKQSIEIYLFYSFFYTFFAGYAYKSLLTAIMTWFSDKAGVASGVLLMGAGLTAFIFNVPTTSLISIYGWRSAMQILSIIALVSTIIASLLISQNTVPHPSSSNNNSNLVDVPTHKMLRSSSFWIFFIWSILLMAGCTSVMGNSVNCGISFGINAKTAALLSTFISLANSLSRICYGYFYDKKGRKFTMQLATTLFFLSAIILLSALSIKSVILLGLSFLLIGLTFGAIPTISTIYILKQYGAKYYPGNFAIQYLYSLVSSIFGTMLFSLLFSKTSNYFQSYSFIGLYAVIAMILLLALNKVLSNQNH